MDLRLMVLTGAAMLVWASPAVAQQFEVGAGIGTSCRGTEGSLCGSDTAGPVAAHASILLADRFELGLRVASGGLADRTFSVPRDGRFDTGAPDVIQVFIEDRSIRYLTGQAIYHFRRGQRIRPLLGFGIGSFKLPRKRRCEPAGCEPILPLLAGPPDARAHSDGVAILGLSVHATRNVVVRGGWQAHNFAGEELSSAEWFLAAGWRFGR